MKLVKLFKIGFLKLISRRKIRPLPLSKSPKFLLLMHQNIGDMIVFSPLIREIKVAYPNSNLQVLASNNNRVIAEENPYIDKVILYQNKWNKLFPLLIDLKSINFDFVVELEAKVVTKVILMLRIINPNCILSVSKREGRYGLDPAAVLPYDYYTDDKLNHQRDTSLDILRLINVNVRNKSYDLFYSEKNKEKALKFINYFNPKDILVGLNITGSSNEKRLINSDIFKIIDGLHSLSKNIIIILIHMPQEKSFIETLITFENSKFVIPSYPTSSILDAAALVDSIDLLLTPDTSLVHIACAFEKPLLAIYRKDQAAFDAWHPKSKDSHVVFSKESNSLKSLDVDEIISKCFELISTSIKKDL